MDYFDFAIDLMKKMVSIPSNSQDEKDIASFLDTLLHEMGLITHLHQVRENSYNVIAKLQGQGAPRRKLLLGGHMDTVKPDKGWADNPLIAREEEGRYYGLGCGDMKGGLAAQITVLKKLLDEGVPFQGEIEIVCLCDEERHSIGAIEYVNWTQEHQEQIADFGIFAEPHYDHIVVGATGKALFRIEVIGSTCHGATPENGINAVSCMAKLIQAVDERYGSLYKQKKGASHCVLQIESPWEGYSLSVPDRCSCLLNKQLDSGETAADLMTDLMDLYQQTVGEGRIKISREIPYYPSYAVDLKNKDLELLVQTAGRVGGFVPSLRINQSVSDGNILNKELGIPVVLFGPQGVNFHKAEEYVVAETIRNYMCILEEYIKYFFKKENP